ncbi:MAG: SEL1-like repeat protein [Proteobacteria bacterium]|nr:SEL1-like repeat protein [Pseudomonadota bacterium]
MKSERPPLRLLSLLVFSCLAGAARADFEAALKEYKAGNLDAAHTQFLQLAELGDCPSQFNLGAMALKGEGVPKDRGTGVGWLQAAQSNGCSAQIGDRLPGLVASLTPEQTQAAAAVTAHFGHDALRARGIVNPDFSCPSLAPAAVVEVPTPEYPRLKGGGAPDAIVISALTIGTDGHARDPEIILSVPQSGFGASAVEAWLNSSFIPAKSQGTAVESRLEAKLRFVGASRSLASNPAYQAALPQASAGSPPAQYLVGLTGNFDASLGVTAARAGQMLIDAARAGNPDAQYWMSQQATAAAACHKPADARLWLEHAAQGGNAAARVRFAQLLLHGSPAPADVARARELLEQALAQDNNYYAVKHAVALLAASPVEGVRDAPAALRGAEHLLSGEIQSDPQLFETVAAAYAANQRYDDAVAQQRVAVHKAQALGWSTAAMEERLASYRADRPWQGDLLAQGGALLP